MKKTRISRAIESYLEAKGKSLKWVILLVTKSELWDLNRKSFGDLPVETPILAKFSLEQFI